MLKRKKKTKTDRQTFLGKRHQVHPFYGLDMSSVKPLGIHPPIFFPSPDHHLHAPLDTTSFFPLGKAHWCPQEKGPGGSSNTGPRSLLGYIRVRNYGVQSF